jgi:hypothetical protein
VEKLEANMGLILVKYEVSVRMITLTIKSTCMGMIMDLWSIGQDLLGMSGKFKEAKKEKKEAASKLFNMIADVLKDTYDKLLNHVYPAGNCQQLLLYGTELYDKAKDIIGEQKARELSEKIVAAHNIEQLYYELQNINLPQKELATLDEAAGFFKATANLMML